MINRFGEILKDPTYLGDGVYAGHDGFQVWVGTEVLSDGRPVGSIALEPHVLKMLNDYVEKLKGPAQ